MEGGFEIEGDGEEGERSFSIPSGVGALGCVA